MPISTTLSLKDLPPREEWEGRFWDKVEKTETCWLWTSTVNSKGYAHFKLQNRQKTAHRLAYLLTGASLSEELHLDHLCRNRRCVNPAHMEPVSHRENILRGEGLAAVNARKETAMCGHPFNEDIGKGHRRCRECYLKYQRAYRAARRLADPTYRH